jgi:hypothetical protein
MECDGAMSVDKWMSVIYNNTYAHGCVFKAANLVDVEMECYRRIINHYYPDYVQQVTLIQK